MSNKYEPTEHPHAVNKGGNRDQEAKWPVDMIELLRKLHGENMSCSMIAAHINADRRWAAYGRKTRNSVIGKVNRLGLAGYGLCRGPYRNKLQQASSGKKVITWTTETDEIIREMAAQGHKSGVIAAAIIERCSLVVSVQNVRFRREALGVQTSVSPRMGPARMKRRSEFSMTRFKYGDAVPMVLADEYKEIGPHKATGRELMLRDVTHSDATCMYPTNSDVRNLEVCGDGVKCGAYCAKHALLAYSRLPTEKRNRAYHRRNEFDR